MIPPPSASSLPLVLLGERCEAVKVPAAPQPDGSRRLSLFLWLFLPLALVLRLWVATQLPGAQRPDEIFQTLEPAHRLWAGYGILAWEWHYGIRSWLFPDFLAGLMALGGWLGLDAPGYLFLISLVLAGLSLGAVAVGIVMGWRHSRSVGALLCGVLCACWPTLIYLAPRTLTEAQAGNVLIVAAGLASLLPRGAKAAERRRCALMCAAIGALLAVTFCLRIQLVPGILLVAAWAFRTSLRHGWLPLLGGGAVPLIALGVSDTLSWGTPFQSVWKYFAFNFVSGGSNAYGVSSITWYIGTTSELWGAALLPVAICFCAGASRAPLLAWLAAVTLLSHSLIGHKEISFIYAALPPVLIVAGIGTARMVLALPGILRPRVSQRWLLTAATLFWMAVAALSGEAALHTAMQQKIGLFPVWMEARRHADLCGIGIYRIPWILTGGYAYLNRRVPIYSVLTPEALAVARPALNYLVIERSLLGVAVPGYEEVKCSHDYCLVRNGPACSAIMPTLPVSSLEQLGP